MSEGLSIAEAIARLQELAALGVKAARQQGQADIIAGRSFIANFETREAEFDPKNPITKAQWLLREAARYFVNEQMHPLGSYQIVRSDALNMLAFVVVNPQPEHVDAMRKAVEEYFQKQPIGARQNPQTRRPNDSGDSLWQ